MNRSVKFPIRLKVMISLLFGITVVVSVITFTMAHFFHEDKRSYINDWISVATRSTAAECRSLMMSYAGQLELASLIMLDEQLDDDSRNELVQNVFNNLPELVEIVVHLDGEQIEIASDATDLQEAGLTNADLVAYREANPLPFDQLHDDQTYLRNSSISPDMPAFTLAFRLPCEADEGLVTVAAQLRLDNVLKLGSKFKVFEVVLVDSGGALLAHPDVRRVAARYKANLRPEARSGRDALQAGMALEFSDQGTPMIGAFAPVNFGGITAAAQVPLAAAHLASRELLGRMLGIGLALLVLMALVGRFWARRIVRPVERLADASRSIGKGRFDIQVSVESRDEIGALADSFNEMATELRTREEKLQQAQAQLIQSEKLAAFGQLGAGIAHEVKNPLAGILGCAQLSLMSKQEGETDYENLRIIEREATRCGEIIGNLMKFARQEKTAVEPVAINDVVTDACSIVNHQLALKEVKILKELDEHLPRIRGSANQLEQVLINLFVNAQQAMKGEPGSVAVKTRLADPEHVEIVVSDTGPGIPEEIQNKLFDPFFTTKPTGEGTGLGLSVSYGIIKEHGGEITIDSELGNGATFVLTLPVMPPAM